MEVNFLLSIIVSILISGSASKDLSKVLSLKAVTEFPALEEYYHSLYIKKPKDPPPTPIYPVEDAWMKKTICRKIFNNPYFDMRDQEWIDVDDPAVFEDIENNYPRIFPFVYRKTEEQLSKFQLYESDTSYRQYPFLYDLEPENDYMFICLVRKRRSQRIRMYRVSQVYDVNLVDGIPMAGRFIFKDSDQNLVLRALAEEPAYESLLKKKTKFAEYRYIKRRQNETSVHTSRTDPICKLTLSNKIRLCATLFASKLFRRSYKFWPIRENVKEECVQKQISFLKRKRVRTLLLVTRNHFDETKPYEEFVIGCTAELINDSDKKVTYYVSRGDVKNTIFAYKHKFSDDRIFVTNYLKNVSVVDGRGNENEASSRSDERASQATDDSSDEDGIGAHEGAESSTAGERRTHAVPQTKPYFTKNSD